jgi:hypothetical protein
MKMTLLAVALLIAIFLPNLRSTSPADSSESASKTEYQTVEHNGIRVTFLELAQSQTPDGKYVSTSILFMVENISGTNGNHSHSAPIRFYDEKNSMLFTDASKALPKTACTVSRFQNRFENLLPRIPKPTVIENTRFVRHWIATRLPSNVAALETEFGLNGNDKTFRFDLIRFPELLPMQMQIY